MAFGFSDSTPSRRRCRYGRWFGLLVLLRCILPAAAYAQGSVVPLPVAPGTEALGRGGAFVAKADSPLALEYNVAGLAQLAGTQVLLDGQLLSPNEGGPCFEPQHHRQRPCYGGLAVVSTDLGVLRRWTFALGFRLPESVTAYGLTLHSSLDPGSVIYTWPRALLFAPSLAVGVQAHPRLALGLAVESAMALALIPCPASAAPTAGCSRSQVGEQHLLNPVVQLGLLGNLGTASSTVLLAASLRSAPNLGQQPILDGWQRVSLPWTVRAGARYLHRRRNTGQPVADLELDGVAQLWAPSDQSSGLAPPSSSLGLRLGGSYYVALRHALLVGRAGLLFDGWLAPPPQTIDGFGVSVPLSNDPRRMYAVTGTVGLGVQTRYLDMDLGYGYLSQLARLPPGISATAFHMNASAESHLLSLSLLVHFGASARCRARTC